MTSVRWSRATFAGWLVALEILTTGASASDPPESIRRRGPPPSAGPVLLAFNRRDLEGFSTFLRFHRRADPQQVFAVADGCLRISGREFGGLITDRSFANYHLIAEWRWGGATWPPRQWQARNSGILVHCVGEPGDGLGSWMPGLESQLIEGGSGDLILVPGPAQPPLRLEAEIRTDVTGQAYFQPGGMLAKRARGRLNWWGRDPAWRDVAWFRGAQDLDHPSGQWNRTELVCGGDRVTCYLNGQVANAAKLIGTTSGQVLLQSEGAEIFFRKFEIRELAPNLP